MVKYADKYGLPKDRQKLMAGIGNFSIIKIEMRESKKEYRTFDENNQPIDKKIPIVYIDVKMSTGEIKKYYSPNMPIIESCKEMLHDSRPDGTLKEPVEIAEVKEETSDKKRTYLYFT